MYPGNHAVTRATQPAFIMAKTGGAVTYAELEARSNRLAHLFRARGLKRLDHYSIFMENNGRYVWTMPERVPYQFHVKVEAADLAGNVGEAITSHMVKVDLAQPRVNIITVEPAAK